jgi:hypothetical protein
VITGSLYARVVIVLKLQERMVVLVGESLSIEIKLRPCVKWLIYTNAMLNYMIGVPIYMPRWYFSFNVVKN